MDEIEFPQYLHKPYQLLFLEADDIGIFTALLILGVMFGDFTFPNIIWFALPVVGLLGWWHMKGTYPRGYFGYLQYFCGFNQFNRCPGYYAKEFQE